jgi:catechol 2,3-dioxygenase-like lactoylglutathione lyase family enzyme
MPEREAAIAVETSEAIPFSQAASTRKWQPPLQALRNGNGARMTSITHITTVVVPVGDQETALAFYVERLGLEKVADFTYDTGERWLEVAPAGSINSLLLAKARPERPAGIETGIVLSSQDVRGDLDVLRAAGVRTDPEPLAQGVVTWWAGAPLAGRPEQFRVFDPDGNSLLIVADLA